MNKAERWHRVSALFDRVVDLPAAEREALLAAECADDPPLRQEVERLLQADERTNPVDRDIAGHASLLLLEGDPHEHEGQRFGPYRIVRLLAQGGMGRVYLAEREGEDFAQTVALKLVGGYGSFDAYNARRRFLDERRILARLQHPNIARLLDGGVGPEAQPWFAMEYVDGAPLTECCDAQRLGVRERLQLFAKVCEAVDHAHRFLIVHRDLKPGNVLVDGRGEPKVLDFGIAKLLDEGAPADRTGSTVLMTPDYAAPEQIRGGQISTATDVYALGAVLFELLTGRKPFVDPLAPRDAPQASKAATEGQRTGERAQARATTPQALRKHLRGDLDRILRTALDPDPARRYRSAEALGQDLRAVAEGKAISLRSDRRYRMGVFLRRHKWETAAAAVAVLGLLATTAWALRQTQHATRQAAIAEQEALASEKVSNLLVSAFDAADPGERSTTAEPTAADVLEAGMARVDEELADVPEIKARMQQVLGRAYMNLGKNEEASKLLRASADAYLSPRINDPKQAAEAMRILAIAEMNQQRAEESIALSRQVLEIMKATNAPLEDIGRAYNVLGMSLMSPGHYDESARVLDQRREILRKTSGSVSKDMATWFDNRGRLATLAGRMREADRFFRESMAMKTAVKETEKSWYRVRGMMAISSAEMGRFDEAQKAFATNLRLATTFYGPSSVHHAVIDDRAGTAYWRRGDLRKAQTAYESAIAIAEAELQLEAPEMGMYRIGLAKAMDAQGATAAAAAEYAHAERILAKSMAENHADRLVGEVAIGWFRWRQSKGASGADLQARIDKVKRVYGTVSPGMPPPLAEVLFTMAEYRLATGDPERLEDVLPPADGSLEQPMIQARREYLLARAATQRRDAAAALAGYARALSIVDEVAGTASVWGALWRLDYAEALAAAGELNAARAQLALAEPVLREQLAPAASAIARAQRIRTQLKAT